MIFKDTLLGNRNELELHLPLGTAQPVMMVMIETPRIDVVTILDFLDPQAAVHTEVHFCRNPSGCMHEKLVEALETLSI